MEDKIKNILVSVMFLGIITFFMSVNILTKDKDISNSERRKLQQFPKITSQSLVDKTWAEDFNKFINILLKKFSRPLCKCSIFI